jgi:hypothetical protein
MKLDQLLWYARRARTMEQGELRARLAGAFGGAAGYLRWLLSGPGGDREPLDPAQFAFCRGPERMLPEFSWRFEPTAEQQADLLAGVHHALGYPWAWTPEREVWHRAPDTGHLWPERFSNLIDYRPGNPIGDVRVMWEPNRLQQLVALALLARFAPEHGEAATSLLKRQLLSWLAANPRRVGVNYASAMECALRILSVCIAADLARPHLDAPSWAAVATIAVGHAALVNARLSLFSSLGNHTVAECTGLLVAALLFQEVEAAAEWELRASEVLEQAARRVILADGGGAEQALHYLAQVLDHIEIAVRVGNCFGRDMTALEAILRKGARFLSAFHADRSHLPCIGDNDEGHALSPHFVSLWAEEARRARSVATASPVSAWTGGGYTIARSARDRAELIFDHGPLGMAPNFGHGHADALAVQLRVADKPILVDAGTYCYGGEPRWRSYFRSTAAHNTVIVDGLSQAKEAGPFLWATAYTCRLIHSAIEPRGAAIFVAYHDGYEALGVVHIRAIKIAPGFVFVFDRLEGAACHELALRWHFAASARAADGEFVSDAAPGLRCVTLGGAARLLEASEAPPAGWRSDRYGARQPSATLEVRCRATLPHEFCTGIALSEAEASRDLNAEALALRRLISALSDASPESCGWRPSAKRRAGRPSIEAWG